MQVMQFLIFLILYTGCILPTQSFTINLPSGVVAGTSAIVGWTRDTKLIGGDPQKFSLVLKHQGLAVGDPAEISAAFGQENGTVTMEFPADTSGEFVIDVRGRKPGLFNSGPSQEAPLHTSSTFVVAPFQQGGGSGTITRVGSTSSSEPSTQPATSITISATSAVETAQPVSPAVDSTIAPSYTTTAEEPPSSTRGPPDTFEGDNANDRPQTPIIIGSVLAGTLALCLIILLLGIRYLPNVPPFHFIRTALMRVKHRGRSRRSNATLLPVTSPFQPGFRRHGHNTLTGNPWLKFQEHSRPLEGHFGLFGRHTSLSPSVEVASHIGVDSRSSLVKQQELIFEQHKPISEKKHIIPTTDAGDKPSVEVLTLPELHPTISQDPNVSANENGSHWRISSTSAQSLSTSISATRTARQQHLQDLSDALIRRMHKMEISHALRDAQRDEQLARLNAENEWLRTQQTSDWALGITDEPPPSYEQ